MSRSLRRHATGLVFLLALAAPAAAQERCVPAAGSTASSEARRGGILVSASAGAVRYALAGGRTAEGIEAGVGAVGGRDGLRMGGGLYRVLLREAPADPTLIRLRVSARLLEFAGIAFCGAGLGSGSVVSSGEHRSFTLAGGIGAGVGTRLAAGRVSLSPFLGVRLLGARTSGEILGREVGTTGGSLGVEASLGIAAGPVSGALDFAANRFDPALGATPYPDFALRLSLGWHF